MISETVHKKIITTRNESWQLVGDDVKQGSRISAYFRGYEACVKNIANGDLDELLLELGWVKK